MLLLSFLAGYLLPLLAVDFASGFVHWLEDTYGSAETPLVGRLVIEPNIRHHKHPMEFTRSSFLSRNLLTLLLAGAVALVFLAAGSLTPGWAFALALGGVANEIHAFTHFRLCEVPAVIRWLQALRILQTRNHHIVGHHRSPFDGHYCALLNVLNPVLDGLRFWRGLEWLVQLATGIPPRARDAQPAGG